jgi:haloacetate dehalogenase
MEVWKPWTISRRGRGIDCGHHMTEEAPDELAEELLRFFS